MKKHSLIRVHVQQFYLCEIGKNDFDGRENSLQEGFDHSKLSDVWNLEIIPIYTDRYLERYNKDELSQNSTKDQIRIFSLFQI